LTILPSPFDLPPGRLLGLDLGEARIGVAVSDEQGILATPLTVVRRRSRVEDFATLANLVRQERVVGVLAGLPLDSQGEVGPQARTASHYARRLAAVLPVPLAFWDESYSTVDATSLLHGHRGRTPIDAAAAAVILTGFLEARRSRGQVPG
jgi:putative Holliday junction resolvase